ncbi:uncharacterized protein LOC132726186, partial [Ruditapes philippinarum]|uniref:uncharacterized protein LOC132726186 n=1 Tax=Ruditapes philippinarum TaxID=129788 RepID=UPI00295AC0CC
VRLNQSTTIRIPMIDPDGDFVRCEVSKFTEIGRFPDTPGLNILDEDKSTVCKVTINTNVSLGYKDETWVVIPITFRDFNTKKMKFGTKIYPPVLFALSSTGTQFTVQVLENLVTPEFVSPTKKVDHVFIVYVGTTWSTDIYAKAPQNTTIFRFIPTGRNGENVTLSSIREDTTRERVAYTTVSWLPTSNNKGQHIICVRVADYTG